MFTPSMHQKYYARPPSSSSHKTQKGGRRRKQSRGKGFRKAAKTFDNKFNRQACDDSMSFHECELAILRQAVDENEDKKKGKIANSEEVKDMIAIVEQFLQDTQCVCYGGTAINNILPEEAQFYNRDVEIPDYDFYSAKPLEHAKELADIFFRAGYSDVEAKAGVHAGTFKVFVNFIPMADITELHPTLFNNIRKDAINIGGILYCPADFLRMNMFVELSRPDGDISRWEKVLKRLTLLNEHHPMHPDNCDTIDFQRTMEKDQDLSERIYTVTRDTFVDQGCVFFGGYASSLYARYMTQSQKRIVRSIPDFDVLSEDVELTCSMIQDRLQQEGATQVSVVSHEEVGEIIPAHSEIKVGKDTVAFVYHPIACHSYNTLELQGKTVRIATIDTMLNFYLAFLYGNNSDYEGHNDRMLCMSQFLFDVEQKNRLAQKGLLKRFSMTCYGNQPTLESIRADKAKKFEELKNKRDSDAYQRLFLKYHPTGASAQRKTAKKKPKQTKQPKKKSKQTKNTEKNKRTSTLLWKAAKGKFLY